MKRLGASALPAVARAAVACVCGAMAAAQTPAPPAAGSVDFTFDQVDVRSFVKLVGDMTGKRFLVDEDVKGKITVVSPKVAVAEVFPLFVSILQSVGCSVIQEGDACKIVAIGSPAARIGAVVGPDDALPGAGLVTKVFRLREVRASDLRKVLDARLGEGAKKQGFVGSIDATNHLIVTDTADVIRRVERIVAEVDKPGLTRRTEIVNLKFANAEDIARQLSEAMGEPGEGSERTQRLIQRLTPPSAEGVSWTAPRAAVVAAPHSNGLIIVGTQSETDELKRIIALMDVDAPSGLGRLNAVFLKHIGAEDAARSLRNLLTGRTEGSGTNVPVVPIAPASSSPRKTRNIAIEAHPANNALLVDAAPADFENVRKLIEQLDVRPPQVLIEVLIAERSMKDSLDVGVEIAAIDTPKKVGDSVLRGASTVSGDASMLMSAVQNQIFPAGLSVGVAHATGQNADGSLVVGYPGLININALRKDGRFRILSNVPLVAQNNREALVNIVDNIPILRSTIQGGSGTARDVIQNIDRVDVGIKLKLVPHVNPNREITVTLNPSIEAILDSGTSATQFTPTIAKRELSTTVTVPDGETIVLTGLIRTDETSNTRRVPLLGSIPVLGFLFRAESRQKEGTNLMIFVRPRLVTDVQAARGLTDAMGAAAGVSPTNATLRAGAGFAP